MVITNQIIVFVVFYMILLVCYLFSETSESFRRRAINKILLASMFALYSFLTFARKGITTFDEIKLTAIFFAFTGDCCLLWNFVIGGIFFSIGDVLFILYEVLTAHSVGLLTEMWWAGIPFVILWGGYYFLEKKGILSGNHGLMFVRFLVLTTAQGCLGISLAVVIGTPEMMLFGKGEALVMAGDYFLGFYHYHRYARTTKWVLRSNSFLYFAGMLMVALSVGL